MMSRRLRLHFAASDVWCSGWHSAAEKSLSVSVTDGLYRMHSQAPNVAISTPSREAVSKDVVEQPRLLSKLDLVDFEFAIQELSQLWLVPLFTAWQAKQLTRLNA